MKEFHIIEDFENESFHLFEADPELEGFTFEQESCHKFENLKLSNLMRQ